MNLNHPNPGPMDSPNPEAVAVCKHGLTAASLSAWRDHDLLDGEAREIGAHVATCAACQQRLYEYDSLIAALRAQPVPQVNQVIIEDLQTGDTRVVLINTATPRLPASRNRYDHHHHYRQRLLGTLCALVAAILLIVSFLQLMGHGPMWATSSTSKPTTHVPSTLNWREANLPEGASFYPDLAGYGNMMGLRAAPSNGNIAYSCVSPRSAYGSPVSDGGNGATHVWVTHDRTARWTEVADIPTTHTNVTICSLLVDEIDPQRVLATITWQEAPGVQVFPDPHYSSVYTSADGGRHWQLLNYPAALNITDFFTWKGVTYAHFFNQLDEQPGGRPDDNRLMVSTDGMQTWQPIDHDILAAGDEPEQLMLDQLSGTLLAGAFSYAQNNASLYLWTSHDNGFHWSLQEMPYVAGDLSAAPDSSSGSNGSWWVCEFDYWYVGYIPATIPYSGQHFACSNDDGLHWVLRGMNLATLLSESPSAQIVQTPVVTAAVTAPNSVPGSYLLSIDVMAQGEVVIDITSQAHGNQIYGQAISSGTWQLLGELSRVDIRTQYTAGNPAGILWTVPVTADSNSNFGLLQGLTYTAAYYG